MTESTLPIHEICLAVGANIGDRLAALRSAVDALRPFVTITDTSLIYETDAAYVTDQPHFLNAALRGTTGLEPHALLFTLKDIEIDIGRRPTFRYGPRAIDIDIVFYGDLQMHDAELAIPHALMQERRFVLQPLADVAPEWFHPGLGKTVRELLAALPPGDDVRPIGEKL